MSTEREEFLITTSVDGHQWPAVWNSSEPMGIDHPRRWEIERSNEGFKLTHVTGKSMRLREDMISSEAFFELPQSQGDPRKIFVNLVKLKPIRPAFLPVNLTGLQYGGAQLFASAGVRDFLVAFEPVKETFKAVVEKDNLFQVTRHPNGDCQILVYANNVRFKVFGHKSRPLQPGVPMMIKSPDFARSALIWGSYWWRFNQVPTPEMLPPDEYEEEEAEADARAFKQLGKTVGMVFAVLLIGVKFFMHFEEPKKPEPKPPVEVALKKPKLLPAPPKKVEPPKPPEPPKVAKVEPPKPKPPEKKPEPPKKKPEPPKKEVAKKPPEPPKKKPEPPKPQPKVAQKPAPPPPALPVQKPVAAPPKQAVTAVPPKPDPTAQAKATLSKSLSFLSKGPTSKANPLSTLPGQSFTNKYAKMGAAAVQGATRNSGASVLTNMAAQRGAADGPITTKGARNISSALSLGGGTRGKALNEVQGRVSLPQLYGSDAGEGIGEALGGKSGVSVTGAGKMSQSLIEKILAKHLAKFQYCYEKALLSDPALGGQIVFQWNIAPGGGVSGVKVVRSQMNNAGLHKCISTEMGRISFSPGPTGGSVTIQHPFAFSASSL